MFDDNNIKLDNHKLDLISIRSLNFIEIDNDKFNAIKIAKTSLDHGGLSTAVLNYTNEIMVNFFLDKKISFTDIVENNKYIMNQFILDNNNIKKPSIDDIIHSFKLIDNYASKLISN